MSYFRAQFLKVKHLVMILFLFDILHYEFLWRFNDILYYDILFYFFASMLLSTFIYQVFHSMDYPKTTCVVILLVNCISTTISEHVAYYLSI